MTVSRTVIFRAASVEPHREATRPSEARPGADTRATVGARLSLLQMDQRPHSGAVCGPSGLCGQGGTSVGCAKQARGRATSTHCGIHPPLHSDDERPTDLLHTAAPAGTSVGGRCVSERSTHTPHGGERSSKSVQERWLQWHSAATIATVFAPMQTCSGGCRTQATNILYYGASKRTLGIKQGQHLASSGEAAHYLREVREL